MKIPAKRSECNAQLTVGDYTLYLTYDANGTPLTVTVNDSSYYYITNIQGDVVGLLDEEGVRVVTYTYDAWGNCYYDNEAPIADHNPLRYRGYVYDMGADLYYLQSRYYDPELGRFLNADAFTSTGQGFIGNNMFAYCGNNPIAYSDSQGTRPVSILERHGNKAIPVPPRKRSQPTIVDEPGPDSEITTLTEIVQYTELFLNCLDVSMGVGMGFEATADIMDFIGFRLGMHGNFAVMQFKNRTLFGGNEYSAGAELVIAWMYIGASEYMFSEFFTQGTMESHTGIYTDDTLTIAEVSAYLGIGFSFRIGFDTIQFIEGIR